MTVALTSIEAQIGNTRKSSTHVDIDDYGSTNLDVLIVYSSDESSAIRLTATVVTDGTQSLSAGELLKPTNGQNSTKTFKFTGLVITPECATIKVILTAPGVSRSQTFEVRPTINSA